MDAQQHSDREESEVLTSQDKVSGFSMQLSEGRESPCSKRVNHLLGFLLLSQRRC